MGNRASKGAKLYEAAKRGDLVEVQWCLNNGADVHWRNTTCFGSTPLHTASENGHVDIVKCLVEKGANVHATTQNGWTPLHTAVSYGHVDVVKFLVERGANVDATKMNAWTTIHWASCGGHLDIVKFLVERGANVHATDKDRQTPLHVASRNGHVKVVRFLVEKNAVVDATDKDGKTPLHAASYSRHVDVVKCLVEIGAHVNATGYNGWTPLHYASVNGLVDVVKCLVERGANVDATGYDGWTPLHCASTNGHIEVVKTLLAARAVLFATNKKGKTPRDLAVQNDRYTVVDLLDQWAKHRALTCFCSGDYDMAEKLASLVIKTLALDKSAFGWIGDTFHQQYKCKEATAAFNIGCEKDPIDGGCALGLVDVALTIQVAEAFTRDGAVRKLAESKDPSIVAFLRGDESMALFRSVVNNPTLYHDHKEELEPVFNYLKNLTDEEDVPPAPQPQPSPAPFHPNIATLVDLTKHLKSFPATEKWPLMESFVMKNRPLATDNHPIFECVNEEQTSMKLVVKLTDERRELDFFEEVWGASQQLKWLKADTHLVRCVKWGEVTIESRKCFALVLLRGESNGLDLVGSFQSGTGGRTSRVFCLKKVVAAVKFLHKNGYVHGDIKLENVMKFSGLLNFKLIDFDNTVRIGSPFDAHCSPEYCPPEMARRMQPNNGLHPLIADPSFDVWCVGVLVLKLFVPMGHLVEFEDLTGQEIIDKIATTGFTFKASLARVEGLDPAQVQVLKTCLAVDPTDRATLNSIIGLVPRAFITQTPPGDSQPPPSPVPLPTTSSHPSFPCIWICEATNRAKTRFRLSCLCELGSGACEVASSTALIELDLQSDLLRGMLPVLQTSYSLLVCLLCLESDGVACREFFACPLDGMVKFKTALDTILKKHPDAASSTTLPKDDQSQLEGLKTALESSSQTEAHAADKWSQLKRLIVQHCHAEATRSALVGLQGPAFGGLQTATFPALGTRWVCASHLPAP